MAHKIIGNRFLSRGEPAWHRLGTVFDVDEQITPRTAVERVAGEVKVHGVPVEYTFGGERFQTEQRVIIREALAEEKKQEPVVLGVVKDPSWVPASYPDLAAGLDPLADSHPVETAGLLDDGGGLCFLSLRGRNWDVAGDEMRSYFIVNLSLTPGKGHNVMHSPVRPVCWNTNTLAIASATINLSIPHSADAAQKIGLAANLVARFETMEEAAQEAFEAFAKTAVDASQVAAIFAAAYPEPPLPGELRLLTQTLDPAAAEILKSRIDPAYAARLVEKQECHDKAVERQMRLRSAAQERFEVFDPPTLRGTAWAAYNAVTELADWREGKGADRSSLWGPRSREKVRAFASAAEIVGL